MQTRISIYRYSTNTSVYMYFYPPDKFELTFALQTGFNYIPLYEGLFSGS